MPLVSENVIPRPGGGVLIRRTVEIEVPAGTSMLEAGTLLQQALQQAGTGMVATGCPRTQAPQVDPQAQGRTPRGRKHLRRGHHFPLGLSNQQRRQVSPSFGRKDESGGGRDSEIRHVPRL